MTNDEIIVKIKQAINGQNTLDKSIKFDFGDDGVIVVDGANVSGDDTDADCTISMSKDNFLSLVKGELDPMMAFMSGKLKVAGDISVAMSLQTLFKGM